MTDDIEGEFARNRRIKGSEMQGPLNMPSGGKAARGASGCSNGGSARGSVSRVEVHKKQEKGRGLGAAARLHARVQSLAAS